MAVTATPKSKTLAIEYQSGLDKAGVPIYAKKSFSGIKLAATDQAIYDVAQLIKPAIGASTKDIYINEVDTLVKA